MKGLTKEEFEMVAACFDCAIKHSDNSLNAAGQLIPLLNKLKGLVESDGNPDD